MIPPHGCGTFEPMPPPDTERLRTALAAFFARMKRERHLSRRRVCSLAGVSESTVREFLAGKYRSMQHDTLEKLAGAAGMTVEQMLGKDDVPAGTGALDLERLHRLLVSVRTIFAREAIELPPREFADLVVALYGVTPATAPADPSKVPPELERLILLYARRPR